jgi:hypothetical protein
VQNNVQTISNYTKKFQKLCKIMNNCAKLCKIMKKCAK